MTITIEATGSAYEIVVGTISTEEQQKVIKSMEEKGIEELGDFYLSNHQNELELSSWDENDSSIHAYGPNDECEIKITNEEGDVLFDDVITALEDECEFNTIAVEYGAELPNKLFYGCATENGTWTIDIDINDDEEFDISLLVIRKRDIMSGNNSGLLIFDEITYRGETYEFEVVDSETECLYVVIED